MENQFAVPPDKQHVWASLKSAGLPDGIKSYRDYVTHSTIGLMDAQLAIFQQEGFPFSADGVLDAHKMAFKYVNMDAGNFRHQVVSFGSYQGSEPHRVRREMDLLESQSNFLFDRANTPTEKLEAAAFTHVKFMRNHPFKDGNGRVGRMFLMAHLREGLSIPIDIVAEEIADRKPEYIKAMNASYDSNDLTPVMGFLVDSMEKSGVDVSGIEVPEKNPAPFTIAPDMTVAWGEDREFNQDLLMSKNPLYFEGLANKEMRHSRPISRDQRFEPSQYEVELPKTEKTPTLKKLPELDSYDME